MTLADKAYADLRRDIIRGTLAAGSKLRMAELRDLYGMGFSPLREALNRLHSERLVVAESLRGFRVSEVSLVEMQDAITTRTLIECDALKAAIANGGDDWAAGIVSSLYALKLQVDRRDQSANIWELEARHHGFHHALLSACASPWKLEFFEQLYAATERYRIPILIETSGQTGRDVQAEHAALAEATLDRDTDQATELLQQHYRQTADFIQNRMQQAQQAIA
jgi:DNA-binding GntR family transcriptional regulator